MWIIIIYALGALFPDTILGVNYPQPPCYKKTAHFATCTDKYQAMPGHLNCRTTYIGRPDNASDEAEIVNIHNELRSSVQPTAANMIRLEYIKGLQHTAQRWARFCTEDSNWFERTTPGAFIPGINTYRSPDKVQWKIVLDVWKAENTSFTLGRKNDASLVGNYTQMISATTTAMGCAVSRCRGYFFYMCLYVPTLNPVNIDNPYKTGQASEDCQNNQTISDNLCDCNGVTCLGGSTLNLTTCSCDCIKTMGDADMYNGTLCELTCSNPRGDDPTCGKPPFTNDSCDTNMDTMFHCPYMCYVCPYAGKDYSNGDELLPWDKGLPNCTTTTSTTTSTTTPTPVAISATASPSGGSTGGTIMPSGSVSTWNGSTASVGIGVGGTSGNGGGDGVGNGTGTVGKPGGPNRGGNGTGTGGNIGTGNGSVSVSSTNYSGITKASVGTRENTSLSANMHAGGNSAQPTGSPGSNPGAFGRNACSRNGISVFWSVCMLIVSTVRVCM